jgi:signal transduction histidine kinase
MKKLLSFFKPTIIATLSLLIVSSFLRYYLYINSEQTILEFKNQNYREIYSSNSLGISSRLSSLSSAINWVCIHASIDNKPFYKTERGQCSTGIFKQRVDLQLPEANNISISFTMRLPKAMEILFTIFMVMQSILIAALIFSTRKSEEEKRSYEISLSKIARQMSHDIRSPLATLNTILDDIKDIPNEKLLLLEKSIERINEVANSLLQDTRTANVPKLITTNINHLIRGSVHEKILEYRGDTRIKLTHTIPVEDLNATLDPIELKRIISNLINNSIDAMKNNEIEIQIKLDLLAENLVIQIIDNGIGIPAHILSKLGQCEVTTKTKGNGLGLYHAVESIKNWNGTFDIESSPDSGTRINITFPAYLGLVQKTILVDDDELVRLTWAGVAKKKNINFMALKEPNQLDELLKTLTKDTIFYIDSDLSNGLKGEDVAQTLHAQGFSEIYMASGYDKNHFSHLTFLKGVQGKAPPWS